jgi:2-polyprenyl-3-methyl-5-hydroxy-6-metoxy-1,4-benzoquinol methylase
VARDTGLSGFALYAFTSAPLIGLALAITGGALVYGFASIKRRYAPGHEREPYELPAEAPTWWHAVERVASRYQPVRVGSTPAERTRFHYVRIKLLGDPVTKMIADLHEGPRALGRVLDIGTGRGQIPIVLLELGRAEAVHGLDWDEGKIEAARHAVEQPPPLTATFEVANAAEAELPAADTVLLIDVLHYLTLDEQAALLDRAARAVLPGGRMVVREADTERGWRSWMTLGEELFFTALRFNRGARVRFQPARAIAARLQAAGLETEVRPAWGKTPFSNVLILGSRPLAEEA